MQLPAINILLLSFTLLSLNDNLPAYPSHPGKQKTPYRFGVASRDGMGKWYYGREIAKTMDVSGAAWLERPNRNEEENTLTALEHIPLDASNVVADLGAGTGYYALRIAEKIPNGKVYAIDIQDGFVQFLEKQKKEKSLHNLYPVKGTDTSMGGIGAATLDLVVMVDVYHELAYPQEMLQAIHRSLKKTGKIVLIEFRGEDPAVLIKPLHKMSIAQAKKEFKANGFTLKEKGDFLPLQHFLLFEKIVTP